MAKRLTKDGMVYYIVKVKSKLHPHQVINVKTGVAENADENLQLGRFYEKIRQDGWLILSRRYAKQEEL